MKTEVRRMLGVAVTCMGLLPLTVSCYSQKKAEAVDAFERGDSYAEKGDHDKAIADYTEAIRLDPKNANFYAFRAKAYRALGDEVKAASDESKVQELKK